MSRLERLVNLLTALIETERPLSRRDLRERVPGYTGDDLAYRRAFERDKDTLRSIGVPITTLPLDPEFPDHGDGYRISKEEYFLPDPKFTHDEMAALALAASAVKLKSQSAAAALWKLGGEFEMPATTDDVQLPESDELAQVFAARRERRTMTFTYKSQQRKLDPYRLTFRNGHWYVNGLDHGHNDVRTYRLDRMEGGVQVGNAGNFPIPEKSDQPWLPPWRMGDQQPIVAQVFIDADQADIAADQAGDACVSERRSDGSIVLDLEVTNRDAFRSFVLGFLDHAEVLGPPELRDEMRAYLQNLAEAGA